MYRPYGIYVAARDFVTFVKGRLKCLLLLLLGLFSARNTACRECVETDRIGSNLLAKPLVTYYMYSTV